MLKRMTAVCNMAFTVDLICIGNNASAAYQRCSLETPSTYYYVRLTSFRWCCGNWTLCLLSVFPGILLSQGPSSWHQNYPIAKGSRQSPIDILPQTASHDPSLGPIVLKYDQCTSINIANNGHSVVVEFEDSDDRSGEKSVVGVMGQSVQLTAR